MTSIPLHKRGDGTRGSVAVSAFGRFPDIPFVNNRPALRVPAEHPMHHAVHLGADADGLHDLDTESLDQVTRDYDLADEAHTQAAVLRLDDHDSLALDQLALHERLPEDDDPIHQTLTVGLALSQSQVLLHQEALRVKRLGVPPGHLGLVLAHRVCCDSALVFEVFSMSFTMAFGLNLN